MAWTTDRMRSMEASRRRGLRKMVRKQKHVSIETRPAREPVQPVVDMGGDVRHQGPVDGGAVGRVRAGAAREY